MPIGDWGPTEILWPVSTIGATILLALFAAVIVSRPQTWRREPAATTEAHPKRLLDAA